jgi:hypothetical protein
MKLVKQVLEMELLCQDIGRGRLALFGDNKNSTGNFAEVIRHTR